MNLAEAADKRISDGITDIFKAIEYPKFLTYASRFLAFSYRNVVMLYIQSPEAQHVAGLNAWRAASNELIPDGEIPILVLYPEFDFEKKSFSPSTRKVFSRPNGGDVKCGKKDLYACFKPFFMKQTGYSVYLSPESTEMEISGSTVLVPEKESEEKLFQMLLDEYLSSNSNHYESRLLSASIQSTARYLIYSYYGLDETDRITFPFVQLPVVNQELRKTILSESFRIVRSVVPATDAQYLQNQEAIDAKNESKGGSHTMTLDFDETCIVNQTLTANTRGEYAAYLEEYKKATTDREYILAIDSLADKIMSMTEEAFDRMKRDRDAKRIFTFPPYTF